MPVMIDPVTGEQHGYGDPVNPNGPLGGGDPNYNYGNMIPMPRGGFGRGPSRYGGSLYNPNTGAESRDLVPLSPNDPRVTGSTGSGSELTGLDYFDQYGNQPGMGRYRQPFGGMQRGGFNPFMQQGGYGGGQQYGFGGYGGYQPFMLGGSFGGYGGFGGGYNPFMGGLGGLFGGMGGQGYGYNPMMGGFGGFGGFTPMGYGGFGGMGGYGGGYGGYGGGLAGQQGGYDMTGNFVPGMPRGAQSFA